VFISVPPQFKSFANRNAGAREAALVATHRHSASCAIHVERGVMAAKKLAEETADAL
jgi:hypothetical protein